MTDEEFKFAWQEEYLEQVHEELDDLWRHGNNHYTVFKDTRDGKFYAANYRVSGDGGYHGIRDLQFDFYEVKPKEKTITVIEYHKV